MLSIQTSSEESWHQRFGGWPLWDSLGDGGSRRKGVLRDALVLASRVNFAPISEDTQINNSAALLESAWVDFELSEVRGCLAEVLDEGGLKLDGLGRIQPDLRPSSPSQVAGAIAAVKRQIEPLESLEPPREAALDGWDDLGSIMNHRILSPLGELRIAVAAKDGSRPAREKLITSNIRLAAAGTRGFAQEHGAMGREDYLQEGILGLIRASEKFDPHLGFRFSTYAMNWISQKSIRAAADKSRMIRLPVHVVNRASPVLHYQRRYRRQFGMEPGASEIAAATTLPVGDVEEIEALTARSCLWMWRQCHRNGENLGRPPARILAWRVLFLYAVCDN